MSAVHASKEGNDPGALMWKAMAVMLLSVSATQPTYACDVAKIMFGKIELQIIPHQGYESALIRHADSRDNRHIVGALLGEITVDRGGFSVRNRENVVVGVISPAMQLEGWDDSCAKMNKIVIRKVQSGAYVIMNGNSPIGTIEGRFPKNGFGVN